MPYQSLSETAVQPAHAPDAAARPRDRGFFESEKQLDSGSDLPVAARVMGIPFGVRGTWLPCLFLMWMRRIALLEGPLCLPRGVPKPVVLIARYGQPDRVLSVVQIAARYAARDPILVWLAHAGGTSANSTGMPNTPL